MHQGAIPIVRPANFLDLSSFHCHSARQIPTCRSVKPEFEPLDVLSEGQLRLHAGRGPSMARNPSVYQSVHDQSGLPCRRRLQPYSKAIIPRRGPRESRSFAGVVGVGGRLLQCRRRDQRRWRQPEQRCQHASARGGHGSQCLEYRRFNTQRVVAKPAGQPDTGLPNDNPTVPRAERWRA